MAIQINVRAGQDAASSSISVTGSMQHVITDAERKSFGITDGDLKNAVGKYFGRNPDDAFVCSPTPWDDLYKKYNWPQVQTMLVVDSYQITGITSEPTIVDTVNFDNSQSNTECTYHADIHEDVTNTTETNWSQSDSVTVSQSIEYSFDFPGGSVGGTTTLAYTGTWGQGGSQSKVVSVGSQAGSSITLAPHKTAKAVLTASRGVMKIRIVYRAYLVGSVAINYGNPYKSHHFWGLSLGSIMGAAGLSNSKLITEDITVGYYANSKVQVITPEGQAVSAVLQNNYMQNNTSQQTIASGNAIPGIPGLAGILKKMQMAQ